MTIFSFNAITEKTNWPSAFPDPNNFAAYYWELLTKEPSLSSFEEACEWAEVDREAYDELFKWAIENKAELDGETRLVLFDAFVRERPKGRGRSDEKKRRDARLKWIFDILVDQYELPKGRNESTSGSKSASAVIEKLPGINIS